MYDAPAFRVGGTVSGVSDVALATYALLSA